MITLKEVDQEHIDDIDERLAQAMERLRQTALEVKAERDKYAAILHRIRREIMDKRRSTTWVVAVISKALED